jgi:hypothetical protein
MSSPTSSPLSPSLTNCCFQYPWQIQAEQEQAQWRFDVFQMITTTVFKSIQHRYCRCIETPLKMQNDCIRKKMAFFIFYLTVYIWPWGPNFVLRGHLMFVFFAFCSVVDSHVRHDVVTSWIDKGLSWIAGIPKGSFRPVDILLWLFNFTKVQIQNYLSWIFTSYVLAAYSEYGIRRPFVRNKALGDYRYKFKPYRWTQFLSGSS